MDNKIPLACYTLAVMSGMFFIGGLVILSSEGRNDYAPTTRSSNDVRPVA